MKKGFADLNRNLDKASKERDEARELLYQASEERDEVREDIVQIHNKIDDVVDTIVPPCKRRSKNENCIIFKIPRGEKSKKVLNCHQRRDNKLPEFLD
jgi:uncharacterized coiled-coil DUF342 family protein